jgi:hypothetical protein
VQAHVQLSQQAQQQPFSTAGPALRPNAAAAKAAEATTAAEMVRNFFMESCSSAMRSGAHADNQGLTE